MILLYFPGENLVVVVSLLLYGASGEVCAQ